MRQADHEGSAKLSFSDLPLERGIEQAKKMPQHSAVSFVGEVTYPAYKYVPISYIFCDKDAILIPDFQKGVIETIQRESGKDVDVRHLDSGHCPNISQPIETATIIRDAIVGA